MSLNQIIKIPSEQSAFDTSGSKNNVDFTLPSNATYDLSKSYIAISVDAKSATAAGAEFIARGMLNLGASVDGVALSEGSCVHIPSGAAFIKNAHLSSQNKGKISDIRLVNKYAFTKSQYSKTTEDQRNDLGSFNPRQVENFTISGCTNEYNTYGNEESRYRTHDIRIPLKEILPYCRTSAHDGNKHGATRLHTEINFDQLKNQEVSLSSTLKAPVTTGNAATNDDSRGNRNIDRMNNITADTGVVNRNRTLVTVAKYASKNFMPFYVGETLSIAGDYDAGGGAGAVGMVAQERTIVEIILGGLDHAILVLNADLVATVAVATGGVFSDLVVSDLAADAGNATLNILNVELVTEVVEDPPPSAVITYDTVLSEEDTYTPANSLNRVYDIPPMCKNFYIMFFKGNGIASDDANLLTYRVAIDNVEQSQGLVSMGSAEHKDNIMRTFANGGGELHNISELYFTSQGASGTAASRGFRSTMIAYPVAFLNRSQKLQVELNATAGQNLSGRHVCFYDVVKQV